MQKANGEKVRAKKRGKKLNAAAKQQNENALYISPDGTS